MTGPRLPAGDGRPVPSRDAADGVDADGVTKPASVSVRSVDGVSNAGIVHAYTRRQALADGVLVDVTQQASPAEMLGGFVVPVAITAALWSAIEAIPPRLAGIADVRGRLHDVLWMAALEARRRRHGPRDGGAGATFTIHLPTAASRQRRRQLRVEVGPDDDGMPCVTIGFPEDF
jgi:hypothetical protein